MDYLKALFMPFAVLVGLFEVGSWFGSLDIFYGVVAFLVLFGQYK